MYSLSLRPSAQKDIQQIVSYYDDINPLLSDRFLDEVYASLYLIESHPEGCQKRLGEIRMAFLKNFSFGIHYKIYNAKVVVISVLHTSRSPKKWLRDD